ncbi:MAG: Ldh family oxidoreductase [Candidatus Atribacteria bacterium]|nr:Ldh family oxidoreductase [Candidatus Atribacteria bacterium]
MIIHQKKLKNAATEILEYFGENMINASLAADCLVRADMRGIFTHGTYLLATMFDRIQAGMLSIPTQLTIIQEREAAIMIDGGNGLGQLAARKAMDVSIEQAQKYGIAITSVRNTNNIRYCVKSQLTNSPKRHII